MIPLSLYIHLPWCVKKCPYCDFNAHPLKNDTQFEPYVSRLVEDLLQHAELLSYRPLTSIFIGGGTPSLFSPDQLNPLFEAIKKFQSIDQLEVTIEANPGARDTESFKGYVQLGINRISIGGQSFNPNHLERLGRVHTGDETHSAIIDAISAGFERINLDIMYGLPNQQPNEAIDDLKRFLCYDLEHLSWYQLNIEHNTLYAVHKPQLPTAEIIDEIDRIGSNLLTENHYHQYEISAWTKRQPSHHNLNYWTFGDYLGIGCGAHSKITTQNPFTITRTIKQKHPKAYLNQTMIQQQLTIPPDELILEYMIGQMRTKAFLSFETFEHRTDIPRQQVIQKLRKSEALELVQITKDGIQITNKGFQYHNDLCLSLT